jgi:hypothetical protein
MADGIYGASITRDNKSKKGGSWTSYRSFYFHFWRSRNMDGSSTIFVEGRR